MMALLVKKKGRMVMGQASSGCFESFLQTKFSYGEAQAWTWEGGQAGLQLQVQPHYFLTWVTLGDVLKLFELLFAHLFKEDKCAFLKGFWSD